MYAHDTLSFLSFDLSVMVVQGTKHKKPPTFGHLPINQGWFHNFYLMWLHSDPRSARKLKKSWVESKKIKSQWKAQKKREGFLQRKGEEPSDVVTSPTRHKKRNGVDEAKSRASLPLSRDQEAHPDTHPVHPLNASGHKQQQAQNISADGKTSLRELTRQAYSRDSLHTHKSNLKRHDTKPSRGNSQRDNTGGGQSASSRDRGHQKGQPNMKLRMTAMLEKIKRDLA